MKTNRTNKAKNLYFMLKSSTSCICYTVKSIVIQTTNNKRYFYSDATMMFDRLSLRQEHNEISQNKANQWPLVE